MSHYRYIHGISGGPNRKIKIDHLPESTAGSTIPAPQQPKWCLQQPYQVVTYGAPKRWGGLANVAQAFILIFKNPQLKASSFVQFFIKNDILQLPYGTAVQSAGILQGMTSIHNLWQGD